MVDPYKGAPKLYPFYSTPDGENCLEKTFYYTKYTTLAGTVFSLYEMVLVSHPRTISNAVVRFGRFTLPFAAMGFVFGSSLCLLGQIRKQTDVANHLIAGSLAGSVWGFKYNRAYPGVIMGLFTGFFSAYFKYFDVHNIPMFNIKSPDERHNYNKMDFTIKMYEDPGRPDRV